MRAKDRKFLTTLLDQTGLSYTIASGVITIEWDSDDDESDEESSIARDRVLERYNSADILDDATLLKNHEESQALVFETRFKEFKHGYYKEKFAIGYKSADSVRDVVYSYIEGVQWVLYYYFQGVPSWSWFYPYHYSVRVSDLKNISEFKFDFQLGKPFRPFDQLMGVLPALSRSHIPSCYQTLMIDANSPIIDFYPETFELDLNGKKSDWEAIVKIPFIEETRLLKAIESNDILNVAREKFLTKEERKRNALGVDHSFQFMPTGNFHYKSGNSAIFPDLLSCRSKMDTFHLANMELKNRVRYLCKDALLGARLRPGFCSIDTIPHTANLGHHGVNLFKSESKFVSSNLEMKPWCCTCKIDLKLWLLKM